MSEPSFSQHARCPFEVKSFEPSGWGPDGATGGMALGRASLVKEFGGGDLQGTGSAEMLSARAGETTGTYVAMEFVRGTLAGRAGTFILQHGGTSSAEIQDTWVGIVPGSGTGELTGLRGRGWIEHGLLQLEYEVG